MISIRENPGTRRSNLVIGIAQEQEKAVFGQRAQTGGFVFVLSRRLPAQLEAGKAPLASLALVGQDIQVFPKIVAIHQRNGGGFAGGNRFAHYDVIERLVRFIQKAEIPRTRPVVLCGPKQVVKPLLFIENAENDFRNSRRRSPPLFFSNRFGPPKHATPLNIGYPIRNNKIPHILRQSTCMPRCRQSSPVRLRS